MANLVSSWSKSVKEVPQDYVYPPGWRPELDVPICKEIPVIDLSLAMDSEPDQILKALEEYGCFQVINHGVSEKLMGDAMEVYKEFFSMPVEEKEKYVNDKPEFGRTGLFSGGEHPTEKIHFWRDTLVHSCYPLEQYIDSWPEKPAPYREVIAEYAIGTMKVSEKIAELIARGLGTQKEYFDYPKTQVLRVNYYPKCPNPALTTGFTVHHDPNILTIIQQNVPGFQLLKDGKWVTVQPLPNAFFVLCAMQFQIISNGRFKAPIHQVATNGDADRISIGAFMTVYNTIIEPAKAFISDKNPPKYKAYTYEMYSESLQKITAENSNLSGVEVCELALASFLI